MGREGAAHAPAWVRSGWLTVPPGAWRTLGTERLLLAWLLLWLLWAPVPLGSQGGWAQGMLAIGMGLGIAGLATLRWCEGRSPLERPGPAVWPLGAMLVGTALSPWILPGLAADRFALTHQALHVLTLLGAGLLTVSLVTTPRRASAVLIGVAAMAVVQGAVSAWMSSQPQEMQWFFLSRPRDGYWQGSFAHPAQWSSGMALCLAAAMGQGMIARRTRFGLMRRAEAGMLAVTACTVAAQLARHGWAAPEAGVGQWPLEAAAAAPGMDLAIWLAPGVLSLPRIWRCLRDTTRATNAGIGVAAALALCVMGVHSLVGASPQAPANILVFVVLLMLAWSPATEAEAVPDGLHPGTAPLLLGLTAGSDAVASDIEQPGH